MRPIPEENTMSTLRISPLLRLALTVDAIATGLTGALVLPFAGKLSALLVLPSALLTGASLVMLVYAAILGTLRSRTELPRWAIWAVIAGNALWAFDCAALALLGWVEPNMLGMAFLFGQAIVVAAFAELQYFGMRRSATVG
jgi:hypothetical protein